MKQSQSAFQGLSKAIAPLLEKATSVSLNGEAKRTGDELTATVEVSAKGASETSKLRFYLTEASIKYVGGNGIRFHHQVVRSEFKLPEGVAVSKLQDGRYTAKLNLKELRNELEQYLKNYEANEGSSW